MYHVRNVVPIEDLRKGKKQAARQVDIILAYFEEYPNQGFTPWALHAALVLRGLISDQTPITSIRRAMTDLTNDGKLEKHIEQQRLEICGVRNCVWRLVQKSEQLRLL